MLMVGHVIHDNHLRLVIPFYVFHSLELLDPHVSATDSTQMVLHVDHAAVHVELVTDELGCSREDLPLDQPKPDLVNNIGEEEAAHVWAPPEVGATLLA